MGFRFDKPDVVAMKDLGIEVHFRSVPKKADDGNTTYFTVCDVHDRWNKRHLLSSDGTHGTKQDAFKDALAMASKMNRPKQQVEDQTAEVERLKKLIEDQSKRMEQLEKTASKKSPATSGAT